LAWQYGFTFAGGHPMAGTQFSGFAYSRADLFKNAPMVIVPKEFDDMKLLERIRIALAPAGFKGIAITSAQEHDRIIAFTSQLPHVVSNAFIKSPTALGHKGISAGSYKDLTRVAWLNAPMWTDLFMQNADHLSNEIDLLIKELLDYKQALAAGDAVKLCSLLEEGKRCKEQIDGKGA
jgi:prephenate dehydrogenase